MNFSQYHIIIGRGHALLMYSEIVKFKEFVNKIEHFCPCFPFSKKPSLPNYGGSQGHVFSKFLTYMCHGHRWSFLVGCQSQEDRSYLI